MMSKSDVDVIVDTSAKYLPYSVYETDVWEMAYELWRRYGMNAERVERMLQTMAIAETEDGGAIPEVPAARVIRRKARDEGWQRRAEEDMKAELPDDHRRWRMMSKALIDHAFQVQFDLASGRWGDNDKMIDRMTRFADGIFKQFGVGAYGSNTGGLWTISAADFALDGSEARQLTEGERSRALREANAASKQVT